MALPDLTITPKFAVGDELEGESRPLTPQRTEWYSIGLFSGATGERRGVQMNIHTDPEYARSQGLEDAIADGMHSTNWLSSMLIENFGIHYLTNGELRTKYIKPLIVGETLRLRGRIIAVEDTTEGTRYDLDVWCEVNDGKKIVDGSASVVVAPTE